jgi:hypothetical protein
LFLDLFCQPLLYQLEITFPIETVMTPDFLIIEFFGQKNPALCATGRIGILVCDASQAPPI